MCKFIELLPHIKGEKARRRELIELEPWQCFVLTTVFGWLHRDTDLRRFRTVYIEVPRKNGKSALSSGVALYMLAADGEAGPEVYSAATTRDQAGIVFKDAKAMADRTAGLQRRFGVTSSRDQITVPRAAGVMRALSRDQGGNLDGLNVHCGVIDELHAHKTREVFDVIETGTGSREQPLVWNITTAGFNRAGICYEQRRYVCDLLNGVHKDDTYFGVIYTIDKDDDWTDPASWAKANPNWNVSVKPDDIERKANKAMRLPSAVPNFLTKHLNVWVNADSQWLDMRAWESQADESLVLEDFAGCKAWIGIDLASKIDLAALRVVIHANGKKYTFGRFYLPEETVENSDNSQYQGWALEGHIVTTPGNVIDFEFIERDLMQICDLLDVQAIPYDPHQATQFSTRMLQAGLPMVEYKNTVLTFSEPMKQLEADVIAGKLWHDGCPVMSWNISNVVCHSDAKDNIYPRKAVPENKIDGVVALIMAYGVEMYHEPEQTFSLPTQTVNYELANFHPRQAGCHHRAVVGLDRLWLMAAIWPRYRQPDRGRPAVGSWPVNGSGPAG